MHKRTNELFTLNPGEIQLYYTCLDTVMDKGFADQCRRILTIQEIEAIQAMTFRTKQYEHLVSRALARYVLARCCKIAPEAVKLCKNRHGKPELAKGVTSLPVRFNISHCRGVVGCAVVLDADIGLDIENKDRAVSQGLAHRFFSTSEIRLLDQADQGDRQSLFLELWTLKEAYVKAVGKGLSLGLDQFSFVFDQGRTDIRFTSPKEGISGSWHFFTLTLQNQWKVAMAVLSKGKKQPALTIHECFPFGPV
jgi:4'-phosphopantetheinyl transferase